MAAIIWNKGEQSLIETWLSGQTSFVPPGSGNDWGLGMGNGGTLAGNTATTTKNATMSSAGTTAIAEIGRVSAGSYGRAHLTRDHTGWPAATLSGSYSTTVSPAVAFTLVTPPNTAVASLWFIAQTSNTIGADDCFFGADLAAVRTFAANDVERITPTFKVQ